MSQEKAKEYLEKARVAVEQSRALLEKCEQDKRVWTAEEEKQAEGWRSEAASYKKMAQAELDTSVSEDDLRAAAEPQGKAIKPVPAEEHLRRLNIETATPQLKEALAQRGFETPEYIEACKTLITGVRSNAAWDVINRALQQEKRTMVADQDIIGGYLLAPIQMVQVMLKLADDQVWLRNKASKFQVVNSLSLGAPTLDDDADDFEFTTELATGSDQDDLKFGKRELKPAPMAKRYKVSEKLIRAAVMDVVAFVLGRLQYKAGLTEEKAYMTGNGINGPLGLFTASNRGISTGRDKSTGNTASALTFDGLKNARWALKASYRAKAEWLFHTDALCKLDLIKDNDGQYIWQPSVVAGQQDRILNYPVNESVFAPNTFSANQYVGMFGDFSYYWIVDALQMQIKVLNELYAESNKIGYILRKELDGAPVQEEAFIRLQLAAS